MTTIETPHLIAPTELGDGRVTWTDVGGDVGQAVTMLHEYDERLSLVRNELADQWEVWRREESGNPTRICSRPGTHIPNPHRLIEFLAQHDTWRGFDALAHVEAANAKADAAADAELDAALDESGDKLAHALAKDLDEPMADGRLIRLGGK